jgi:hypothetical protein
VTAQTDILAVGSSGIPGATLDPSQECQASDGVATESQDPAFLETVSKRAERVTLGEGEVRDVGLRLIRR